MAYNDSTVIGTFSGICADAAVTNENGLDITRPVWENVFNSDIYKEAIELGHYIGFLGHPDDPGDQNFMNACIVMTEGHIDDDDKVYGTFNLVDTPVGRVVKSFIDAGVTFGISVRGAGDIVGNSVDPDTFVFRGFDLVTFPAYKEAIPEFKEIAASTDIEQRQKYKKVCAAVETEISQITSCDALSVIQEQFPEQSDTYTELENRKLELQNDALENEIQEKSIEEEKIDSLVSLYLKEKKHADEVELELEESQKNFDRQVIEMNRKMHAVTRIVGDQERAVQEINEELNSKNSTIQANSRLIKNLKSKLQKSQNESKSFENKLKTSIAASAKLKSQLHDEKENNLQYHTKIEASEALLAEKDATIRSLQQKLDKTVVEASTATNRASNLDGKVAELKDRLEASQQLIEEYQDAYATLYSRAVGIDLKNVSVTASTTVADLQKKITGSSAQLVVSDDFVEPQQIDIDDNFDDDNLVIL